MNALFAGMFWLVLLGFVEWRRTARIGYLAKAERLRIRLSDFRHRLTLLAGSGSLRPDDKKAFEFIYHAITLLLRYPLLYVERTDSMRSAMMSRRRREPPRVQSNDFSSRTRPFLGEYVGLADELAQTFANPFLLLLASMSARRVLGWARHMGSRIREIGEEKRTMNRWRQQGRRALNAPAYT